MEHPWAQARGVGLAHVRGNKQWAWAVCGAWGGMGLGRGIYIYIYIPGAASRCLLGPRLLSQPVPGTPERAETVGGGLVSSGKQHPEHNGTANCTHEQ